MTLQRALVQLNLGFLFMSTSGVLGRAITMDSTWAIWSRAVIGGFLLFAFCRYQGYKLWHTDRNYQLLTILCGALLAIHWVTIYYAFDTANVAIGILTLYSFPALTAFTEPWILGTRFRWQYVLLALIMMIGLYIMSSDSSFGDGEIQAIILSLISAVSYSFRNVFTKKIKADIHGSVLMMNQVWVVFLLLIPLLFFISPNFKADELYLLFLLGLLTTALGHTLFVIGFKQMSVSKASLLAMLVPIYGVILAYLFLGEIPTLRTLIGGGLILLTASLTAVWRLD